MNRRYLIAAAAVVAVAGGWYLFGQGGGGGGAPSGTGTSGSGPQISGQTAGGGGGDAGPLYGYATATVVSGPSGALGSLSTFGRPRDAFVQINGAGGSGSSSLTFGSTPTTTSTAPVSLGSGPTTAVPPGSSSGGGGGTGATAPIGPPTTTTPTQTLAAEFDINGEPVVAYNGDAIPPETQQFTVNSMTTRQVTLGLNGALLASGASSVVIKVGQTITLNDETAHTTTVVHLISVHPA